MMIEERFVLLLNPLHYLERGEGVRVRDETGDANLEDIIDSLRDGDALTINTQDSFDGVYHCIRSWKEIKSNQKSRLLDVLTSNVPFLVSSISKLSRGSTEQANHLTYHRNAIQQYVFFLSWLSSASEADSEAQKPSKSDGGKAPVKPKGKKGSKEEAAWDWTNGNLREKLLQALLTALRCDCSNLFDGPHEAARMIDLCIQTAMQVLESPASVKKDPLKLLAFEIMCRAAVSYKKAQLVASTLMSAIRKRQNEHLSEVAGVLAKHAEEKHQSNQIALALITEFVKIEPSGYDEEAGLSTPSVKHQADTIACLAELTPRTISNNMSRLIPYLSCNTYQVRSSIVHMIAATLAQTFSSDSPSEGDERGGTGHQSRLTSKQHCIMLLLQRINDKSAYTRKEVLKAWAALAEQEGAIPLPLYPKLVQGAHSRLRDGSVMVVKEALHLLQALIACAPFGAKLDASAMLATVRELEARLEDLRRSNPGAFDDYVIEEAEEKVDEGAGGGEWKVEAVSEALVEEGGGGGDAMEVDGEAPPPPPPATTATATATATAPMGETMVLLEASETQPQPSLSALGALSQDVTTLRTLVATLKTGVHFTRCLLASLPEVRGLLSKASPAGGSGSNADVVKEALGLLAICRRVKLTAGVGSGSGVGVTVEASQDNPPSSSSSSSQPKGDAKAQEDPPVAPNANEGGESEEPREAEEVSAEASIRTTWPLVFSRDEAVREAVVDSMYSLYLSPTSDLPHSTTRGGGGGGSVGHKEAARELIKLANHATLGELSSLDEILRHLLLASSSSQGGGGGGGKDRPYALHREVICEVVKVLNQSLEACLSSPGSPATLPLRSSLVILSSISAHKPEVLTSLPPLPPSSSSSVGGGIDEQRDFVQLIVDVIKAGLGPLQDAWVARWSCLILKGLAPALNTPNPSSQGSSTLKASDLTPVLCRVVLTQGLPDSTWSSAAEAAIDSLYSIHPQPQVLMEAVLSRSASEALDAATRHEGGGGGGGASKLGRFFFTLGHVALNQLSIVDNVAKKIRRARALGFLEKQEKDVEGSGPAAAAAGGGGGGGDFAAQVGMGAAAADAELDALKETIDREIMSGLIGSYGSLVQSACRSHSTLLSSPSFLRSSALLSLTKLMAVNVRFCEANLHHFFGLLACSDLEAGLRCNLVVALGDLAFRFPNSLEPWTTHMYHPLGDKDLDVRKRSLSVLSHLVLNDMMKVKGHIARLAICMRSQEDPSIRKMARAFFSTLAAKSHRNSNPIYNLLPDILSHLSAEKGLPSKDAEEIMIFLLDYVKQDKQQDALREKIICRFELVVESGEWSLLAKCVTALGYSDKGMRRIVELLKCYKVALGQVDVYKVFSGLLIHARKHGDKKGDLKDLLVDYEAKIKEAHQALRSKEADALSSDQPYQPVDSNDTAGEDATAVEGDEMDVDQEGLVDQLAAELDKKLTHQQTSKAQRSRGKNAGKKANKKKEESSDEKEGVEDQDEGPRGSSKRAASTNPTPVISRRKRREVVCDQDDDNAPSRFDQLESQGC